MINPVIDEYGIRYTDENGLLHREDGPALIWEYVGIEWCIHGKLHRKNALASILIQSNLKAWYLYGDIHNLDGAAATNGKSLYGQYFIHEIEIK